MGVTTIEPLRLPVSAARALCYSRHERRFLAVGGADVAIAFARSARRRYAAASVPSLGEHRPVVLDGTTLLFCEDATTGHMLAHHFHLLEHVLGVWPWVADRPESVRRIVLASDGRALRNWRGPNLINQKLLGALFPCAEVLVWRSFQALAGRGFVERLGGRLAGRPLPVLVLDDALIADRALALADPACLAVNKMLAHFHGAFEPSLWQRLADAVLAGMGVMVRRASELRVTHVVRARKRRLAGALQKRLHAAIADIPGVSLRPVDFAMLSYETQLEIAANSDVLMGVHGNGLSHGFFLPPHGALIELFPAGGHALDYRFVADFRGLQYLGLHPEHGVIDDRTAFRLGGCGDLGNDVDGIAIEPILAMIRRRASERNAA
jgi:hypothetical protein